MSRQPDAAVTLTAPQHIARWLGAVYVIGALTATVWIALPHAHQTGDSLVRTMALVSLLCGVLMMVGYADHIRPNMVHVLILGVQLIITISYLAIPDPANDARLFYIWATPVAAFFFRPLLAAAHAAIVGAVLAAGLWIHSAPLAQAGRIWLMTIGTLIVVNVLVGWAAVGTRRRDAAMKRVAHHDHLTGLPNRVLFAERTTAALERLRSEGGSVLLMLIDLDHFKLLNDTHGHLAGDELLVCIAGRLCEFSPSGAVVARLGGDEFAILVHDPGDDCDPLALAHQVARAWSAPVRLTRGDVHTSACLGIAAAMAGDDPTSLLGNADGAMYRAKAAGRGGVCVYDEHQRTELERQMAVATALHDALPNDELSIMYQPIVDIVDGTVRAVEALLRWTHGELGIIAPGEFIPLAEQNGLIDDIGLWVMDQTLGQLARWRADGIVTDAFRVEVNVSAAQLHGDFAGRIATLLTRHHVEPAALMLELTESVLMHAGAEGSSVLEAIDALGVPLALDDFGTGFSSLAYLYQTKVDTVKIDQSFIGGMSSDRTRRAIVDAMVSLTKSLDLEVIAEGVDTEDHVSLLVDMGCRTAQGFHFARPMSAAATAQFLTAADRRAAGGR
ncbi:MAG TPA: EAL domain-containing protein [Ilumatobacteraceae bacterium]